MMIEYRVKLVRGSYGTRSWKYVTVHTSSPHEAVKMARAELGEGWTPASIREFIGDDAYHIIL